MILVVVAMQAVAPDRLQIREPIDEAPHALEMLAIRGVVHRIGFGDARDAAIDDVLKKVRSPQPNLAATTAAVEALIAVIDTLDSPK